MSGGRVCFNVAPRGFDTDDTLGGGKANKEKLHAKPFLNGRGGGGPAG